MKIPLDEDRMKLAFSYLFDTWMQLKNGLNECKYFFFIENTSIMIIFSRNVQFIFYCIPKTHEKFDLMKID